VTIFLQNRALLDQFKRGDRAALTAVYRHYVNDIEGLLRRWSQAATGSRSFKIDFERQRDVLQEIFIKAFSEKVRTAYDGIRPYRPYLITIAKSVLIDHLRKQSREVLLPFDSDDEDRIMGKMEDAEVSDDDRAEDLHWQRCLTASKQYVEGLDASTRRFVELRFIQEMPQLSISETMGMTRWKVRSMEKKVQRGLEKYLHRMKLI
jgi:RNA polymerase sigma factor (sigma-70 family)